MNEGHVIEPSSPLSRCYCGKVPVFTVGHYPDWRVLSCACRMGVLRFSGDDRELVQRWNSEMALLEELRNQFRGWSLEVYPCAIGFEMRAVSGERNVRMIQTHFEYLIETARSYLGQLLEAPPDRGEDGGWS